MLRSGNCVHFRSYRIKRHGDLSLRQTLLGAAWSVHVTTLSICFTEVSIFKRYPLRGSLLYLLQLCQRPVLSDPSIVAACADNAVLSGQTIIKEWWYPLIRELLAGKQEKFPSSYSIKMNDIFGRTNLVFLFQFLLSKSVFFLSFNPQSPSCL